MTTLTDFLLARIAEDEAAARAATLDPWSVSAAGVAIMAGVGSGRSAEIVVVPDDFPDDPDIRHIARHDPARVLAECEAKRAIVERAAKYRPRGPESEYAQGVADAYGNTLRHLATAYADHPDYREEWKP